MSERHRHPSPGELLQFAFGDSQPEEEARIQAHLAACPECLAQVEDIRATERAFSAAYQTGYAHSIPPPPRNWQGFRGALSAQAGEPVTLSARLKAYFSGYMRTSKLGYALPVLGAVVLVVAAFLRLSQTPVVSAGEILRRAAAAERESLRTVPHAAVYQKMRVRVGHTTLTRVVFRDVERHRQVDRWSASGKDTPPSTVASDLARDFHSARLDWDDPLSPTGMQRWLAERDARSSEAQQIREDGGVFTLTSRVASEPVAEARFVVRAADFHPVSAHYRFHDRANDVELTELAYEIRALETLDAAIRSELSRRAETTDAALDGDRSMPPAGVPSASNPESLEVDALYALHQHHADLGGETEVVRQGNDVKVAGVVVSAQRKAELRAALAHLPDVRVELQTAQEAAERQARAIASAPETANTPGVRTPALKDALATRFPDQSSRDSFVLVTLECSQQALARGFALHRLAARFRLEKAGGLSKEARRELQAMSTDHLNALRRDLNLLIERLAPLAADAVPERETAANSTTSAPEPAALVPDLQRLDRIVSRLVSGADAGQSDPAALLREYQLLCGRLKREVVAHVALAAAAR